MDVLNITLVVTKMFKDLHQEITADDACQGVVIKGPKGTGKSTSCLYLWKMLKEDGIPLLVISASLNPGSF